MWLSGDVGFDPYHLCYTGDGIQTWLLLACHGKVLLPFLRMCVGEHGSALCRLAFLYRATLVLGVQLVILILLHCKTKREADL